MAQTFPEFLAARYGRQWCVASRLTPRRQEAGYEHVIPPKRFSELRLEWERETYGATPDALQQHAPELLAMVKALIAAADEPPGAPGAQRAIAEARILVTMVESR